MPGRFLRRQVDERWWFRIHHESGVRTLWWFGRRLALRAARHHVGWYPGTVGYCHHRCCGHPLGSLSHQEIKKRGCPVLYIGQPFLIYIMFPVDYFCCAFRAAIDSFKAAIFSSESLCFLRSKATTCSGAFCTKRSLDSFFITPARKPSRCLS